MPRGKPKEKKKKGNVGEDDFVVEAKQEIGNDIRTEIDAFISELLKHHSYWIKKGRKLTCSVCSVNVQFSSLSVFQSEVHSHMKSKSHKKKVEFYKLKEDKKDKHEEVSQSQEDEKDKQEVNQSYENEKDTQEVDLSYQDEKKTMKKSENLLSDAMKEFEYHITNGVECSNKDCLKFGNPVVDFEMIYSSLDKDNPVTQASKKFVVKAKDGKNYFCTVCQEIIFDSLDVNKCRYNLWSHINDEAHRMKLPNFSKVERDFKKLIHKLSKKIPSDLKGDLKYFEIGPVYRFVKCTLCDVAVSDNFHRLENHIVGIGHQNKKQEGPKEYSQSSRNSYVYFRHAKFISEVEAQLEKSQHKEDLKFIHIGKMRGYVVCSLCSDVVIPTFYYLQEHFVSDKHVSNKTANLINWESTLKTDFMNRLQVNLSQGSRFPFKQCEYGFRCLRCSRVVPPTSYALFCHLKNTSECVQTRDMEGSD